MIDLDLESDVNEALSRERFDLASTSINFGRTNDQQTLPLQLLQFLLSRKFRLTIRSTPVSSATRTDVYKSATTIRARSLSEANCSARVNVPVWLFIVRVSHARKVKDQIKTLA